MGKGGGAEEGGRGPQGVALRVGEDALLELVLEEHGAVVPVEGEGAARGGGGEGRGEVGVVDEGDGEEDVEEEGVLGRLVDDILAMGVCK